ncbi:MAG: hypothetical protein IT379_23740 [Deltaproteobacteria bacterium]|nr:hypothetical protein [Deltaproteobacteria bacterium]
MAEPADDREAERGLVETLSLAAEGDLRARPRPTAGRLAAMTRQTERLLDRVTETVVRARRESRAVTMATRDLTGAAEHAATSTSIARASLDGASDQLRAGTGRLSDAVAQLELLGDLSSRTGMLALNAAIEAARVGGEAARALAMVAEEIRKLAQRSAAVSQEVLDGIEAAQQDIQSTLGAIEEGRRLTGQASEAVARCASSSEAVVRAAESLETAVTPYRVDDPLAAELAATVRRRRDELLADLDGVARDAGRVVDTEEVARALGELERAVASVRARLPGRTA